MRPEIVKNVKIAPWRGLGFGLLAVILLAACGSPSTPTATPQKAPAVASQPTTTAASPGIVAATSQPSAQYPAPQSPGQKAGDAYPAPQTAAQSAAAQTTVEPYPAPQNSTDQSGAQPTAATTPVCSSPAALTPALTEGPYFKAGSPERANLLEAGMPGTVLVLTGSVLTSDCQPVAHALLDFWQADASGNYDNAGYTLRGHQYTDENGRYQLTTVVPGLYPGRTEHIHFKVQAPNGPVLTSQLFFPGVSNNESDQIFDPSLVIHITQEGGSQIQATFDFIISP